MLTVNVKISTVIKVSDELFLENKQNKFSFLVQQSQSHKT